MCSSRFEVEPPPTPMLLFVVFLCEPFRLRKQQPTNSNVKMKKVRETRERRKRVNNEERLDDMEWKGGMI